MSGLEQSLDLPTKPLVFQAIPTDEVSLDEAFTQATRMSLAASPMFAFNLSYAANADCAMQTQKQQGQMQAPEAQANLLNTLGSELKITPEQAVGGGSESQSALSNALGNNVENRNDLDTAFKALGMDTGMIGQFAPLILQYLGQQGIAGSLLQNLGSLWITPAPVNTPSV